MLTRRRFLRNASLVTAGSLAGLGTMTLGQRLLTAAGGGGIIVPNYNDEFESGTANGWIARNTADFDPAAYPGNVLLSSGAKIARATVPPPPFTVTARCTHILYDNVETTFANASLGIGGDENLSTDGPRYYNLQWDVAFLGEIGVIDGLWEGYADTPTHLSPYVKLGDGTAAQVPHYQRLVVNSGTDIDSYYSLDGETWTPYATGVNPNVEVEAVLLISNAVETAWDWVRFS